MQRIALSALVIAVLSGGLILVLPTRAAEATTQPAGTWVGTYVEAKRPDKTALRIFEDQGKLKVDLFKKGVWPVWPTTAGLIFIESQDRNIWRLSFDVITKTYHMELLGKDQKGVINGPLPAEWGKDVPVSWSMELARVVNVETQPAPKPSAVDAR